MKTFSVNKYSVDQRVCVLLFGVDKCILQINEYRLSTNIEIGI